MSGLFDQYSGIAGGIAGSYGIPTPIFYGLIQQESGWNPNAVGDNGAAYGFGQLHAGAATDTGFNRFDPISNLKGTAAYLSKQYNKYGNWNDALSAYNQGHAGTSAGNNYAASVWNYAQKFFGGSGNISSGNNGGSSIDPASAAACAASGGSDVMACASVAGGFLGGSGNTGDCGMLDFVCKLQKWVSQSEFFTRLGLAVLAFILILGGLYLMKERN